MADEIGLTALQYFRCFPINEMCLDTLPVSFHCVSVSVWLIKLLLAINIFKCNHVSFMVSDYIYIFLVNVIWSEATNDI